MIIMYPSIEFAETSYETFLQNPQYVANIFLCFIGYYLVDIVILIPFFENKTYLSK